MSFRYKVGCRELNLLDGVTMKCDTCKITYCNLCKVFDMLYRNPGILALNAKMCYLVIQTSFSDYICKKMKQGFAQILAAERQLSKLKDAIKSSVLVAWKVCAINVHLSKWLPMILPMTVINTWMKLTVGIIDQWALIISSDISLFVNYKCRIWLSKFIYII